MSRRTLENPFTVPRLLSGVGLACILGAFAYLWLSRTKAEIHEGVVGLLTIGIGAVLAGGLLPKLKSVSIGKDSVAIELRDLGETLTNDVVALQARIGELEVTDRAHAPAPPAALAGAADATPAPAASGWRDAPPELDRRGAYRNDLRKGVFGGSAKRNGLELAAEFLGPNDKPWTKVRLIVRPEGHGPPKPISAVEFFLHDTFHAPRVKVAASDGRAQLELTIWGGFTVGVWAPEANATLELDLAALPDAPRIVREL